LLVVQDLQRQVDDLNVKSPVDGQVGQLFIAERATVAKDAQLLSVIDLSALQVEMQVPESFARDLGIGMAGEISGNGHVWKGLVSAISPEVVNGQVAARLRFDGETPKQLRQNQRLSVRVLLDKRDNVLTVQRGSFVDESGGSYAYVVRDGIATKTPIRVGTSSIDKVEILDGLKEGDRIVISGTDSFKSAATVAISN
jgi:HlyD family secretion protein